MKFQLKIIVLFCFFYAFMTNAQTNDLYLVKLKSGLTIKCELLKVVPDSFITIRQFGLVSQIKISDVDSVVFNQSTSNYYGNAFPKKNIPVKRPLPDSVWSVGLSPGATAGTGYWGGLTTSFSLRFNMLKGVGKRSMLGFGLGVDPYGYTGEVAGPVFLEGRYFLEKQKPQALFVYSEAGYGFNLVSARTGKDGGPMLSLGMGRMYRTKNQNMFSWMFGWRYQYLRSEQIRFNNFGVRSSYRATNIFTRVVAKVEWRF